MPFPNSNLPADSQPWGREIQSRLDALERLVVSNDINNTARDKQLESSFERLNRTFNQQNANTVILNSSSDSNFQELEYVGGDPARTDFAAASVTFNRPFWATKATVFAVGTVLSSTLNAGSEVITGSMRLEISGGFSPVIGIDATITDVRTTSVMPFSRTFSPGSTITVRTLVTKAANGSNASYRAGIVASVFWSSN